MATANGRHESCGTARYEAAAASSSGIGTYPVTWASRVERPDGRTSPEELLAASHSCYAMALIATLTASRHEPQRLDVTARISLDPREGGGFRTSRSELVANGMVPGLDQAGFQEGAEQAEQACPISNSASQQRSDHGYGDVGVVSVSRRLANGAGAVITIHHGRAHTARAAWRVPGARTSAGCGARGR
jgi:osmotically inducible protein OsmC